MRPFSRLHLWLRNLRPRRFALVGAGYAFAERLPWLRRAFRAFGFRVGLYHLLDFRLISPRGDVLWEALGVPNRLFNQGEIDVLQDIYQGIAFPTAGLYGRLYNQTPVDGDTLVSLSSNEMKGSGYGALVWVRNTSDWATPTTLASGEGETIGAVKAFTASGGQIGPFTYFVLATTAGNTGRAFAYAPFGAPQTIAAGATLQVRPRGRLRGVTA